MHETCTARGSMQERAAIAVQEVGLLPFERAAGQTLRELLAKGARPNRDELIDWGCQILGILAGAHGKGHWHRHINEDSVVVLPDGRIVLAGFGRPQLAGDPLTVQSDLHAVGSLLRRLSFASRLKSGGGVVGPNGRDPLLKVLARATFRDPALRYRSAADMAEALRQAGRVRPPLKTGTGAPAASTALIMRFPAAAPAQAGESENDDRRWALLLLAVTLLLLLSVIGTGWLLLDGDTLPAAHDSVKSSLFAPSMLKLP